MVKPPADAPEQPTYAPQPPAADAALRSPSLLDAIFTHAPDGILILRWPRVLLANPAGARLLGVPTPAQAVGVDITTRMAPHERAAATERIDLQQGGEALGAPRTYRARTQSGHAFDVEISSIPIEFEGAPATLALARDVTERNLMLRKLAVVDMHAAVNTLAAGVAHEINNPIAYVLLNLEFLARELRDLPCEPQRADAIDRRIADTRQGVERVRSIVRDLQSLTRKDEDIRSAVEVDQVIESAISSLHRQLRRHARIETALERVACVTGNTTRLEQLVVHLLMNAAQAFEDEDAPHNLVRVTLAPTVDGQVAFEVSDNGGGMDHAVLSRVFEPFFTTKPQGVGSGLGLPICKRIVDDMGGRMVVTSQPRQGTTVRVTIPANTTAATMPPAATAAAATRRGRVLIIDDERAVVDSLRVAFRDDHDIDTASTSKEARAALDADVDYDMVLCDLVMPVESGMDLHAYASEQHPELAQRFVFMTGGAFTPRAEKFLRDMPHARIEKPFELDALKTLIDTMVARRGR